uniref:Lachrymatory-factor synthase n=1 Tax=Cajanus cajan TaxID=3821 RepID=A0A151RA17_CAJCA|nr:Lachrymatory-factor synthase [Cajanus cajan]
MDYSTRKRTRKCKMEGQGTAQVQGFKVEQVWLLLEDFFGLEKWFPHIPTCIPVEGISGKSGCVRFCAGFITPYQTNFNWTKQKLLSIDLAHWTLTYSIVEGNVRVHSYHEGCEIEWLYEVEPIQGCKLEYLDSFLDKGFQVLALRTQAALKTMEEALRSQK